MEIRRCAARRVGAEIRTVVRERTPQVLWDAEGKRLILRGEENPSWKDDGTHWDYDVLLTLSDLERIRQAMGEHSAEASTAAGPPRD
jgi:hypothetical protein